jgi:hypothetical protein
MGPCLCGDTACSSCNPGGREAEAQAERVAEILAVHLGRIGTTRKITIVDGWGEGLHHPIPTGTPLVQLLELVEVRTLPIPERVGAESPTPTGVITESTAAEALDGVILDLGIELEGEAYGEGYEAGAGDAAQAHAEAELDRLDAAAVAEILAETSAERQAARIQASGAWPWRVPTDPQAGPASGLPRWEVRTEDGDVDGYVWAATRAEARALAEAMGAEDFTVAPDGADPIPELLAHLAELAAEIEPGAAFHGGPLDGASRYNVALAGLREIVAWDHQRRGPQLLDCAACGKAAPCSPQGATSYPLCLACYQVAILEATAPAPLEGIPLLVAPELPEGTAALVTTAELEAQVLGAWTKASTWRTWQVHTEAGELLGTVLAPDHAAALETAHRKWTGELTAEVTP